MFIATHIWIYCKIRLTSIPLLQDHAPLCQILLLKLQNCTLHYIIRNPKMEMISLFNYCEFLGSMSIFQGVLLSQFISSSYSRQCHSRLWRSPGDAPLLWVVASVGDGHAAMWEARKRCNKKGTRERELLEIHEGNFMPSKKIQYNQTDPFQIIQQPTCFLCLFWWKRDLCITKQLTFA